MFGLNTTLISSAVSFLVGAGLAGWLAYGVASGNCAKRELAVTKEDNAQLVSRIEAANRDTEAELTVSVAESEDRGRKDAAAQEVVHEAAADTDRSCEWSDAQRLRIDNLYAIYGYSPDGTPLAVRGQMPASPLYRAPPTGLGD